MTTYFALNVFLTFVFSFLLAIWIWRHQHANLAMTLSILGVSVLLSSAALWTFCYTRMAVC